MSWRFQTLKKMLFREEGIDLANWKKRFAKQRSSF